MRVFGCISLLALGFPLVLLGALGWFARYAADDYCTASQVATAGLLKAQSILYVSWSGRFAATLLITLAELFGPLFVRVLPGPHAGGVARRGDMDRSRALARNRSPRQLVGHSRGRDGGGLCDAMDDR